MWILESVECIQTLSLPFQGHGSNNSLAKTGKKLYNPERCTVKFSQKYNKDCSDRLKGPSNPLAQTPASNSRSLILFTNSEVTLPYNIFLTSNTHSAAQGLPKAEEVLCLLQVYFWIKIPMSFIAWDVFLLVPLQEMTESCPVKSAGKS